MYRFQAFSILSEEMISLDKRQYEMVSETFFISKKKVLITRKKVLITRKKVLQHGRKS